MEQFELRNVEVIGKQNDERVLLTDVEMIGKQNDETI
jgi:hypothetical protein